MDLLILSPGVQGGTGFIPQCLEGGKNVAGMLDREPNKAEECLTLSVFINPGIVPGSF